MEDPAGEAGDQSRLSCCRADRDSRVDHKQETAKGRAGSSCLLFDPRGKRESQCYQGQESLRGKKKNPKLGTLAASGNCFLARERTGQWLAAFLNLFFYLSKQLCTFLCHSPPSLQRKVG